MEIRQAVTGSGQQIPGVSSAGSINRNVSDWIWPAVMTAGGMLGTWWTNKKQMEEAQRNRDFQRDMSNTEVQRRTQDMIAAGYNPALAGSFGAGGASGNMANIQDMGEGGMRGLASALALKQAAAQIEYTKAQTEATTSERFYKDALTNDVALKTGPAITLSQAQTDLANANTDQIKRMLPTLINRAKAEIEQLGSSARAAKARAILDEMAKTGAANTQEFERQIQEYGPWIKLAIEALKALRGTEYLPSIRR